MHLNIFLLVCSVALIGCGIPLALKRVEPNSLYGMRIHRTLSNERIWYKANSFGGWLLCATGFLGIALSIASSALSQFRPGLEWAVFVATLMLTIVATILFAYRTA